MGIGAFSHPFPSASTRFVVETTLPEGARDAAGFPNITTGLLERGYTGEKIRKILGENLLRVFAQAEAVAGR